MPLHYDLLEPKLGISARPASGDDLRGTPFGGILNLCDFRRPRYAETLPAEVELVMRPINDEIPVPLPTLQLAVLELADMPSRGVATLVHCRAGQSRSPAVIALYWMARDGVYRAHALDRMRKIRPVIEPNRFFQTEPARDAIVDTVRRFMAGSPGVLEQARNKHAVLIETLKQSSREPAMDVAGVSRATERLLAGPGPVTMAILTLPRLGLLICVGTGAIERDTARDGIASRVLHWDPALVEDKTRLANVLRAMRGCHDQGLDVCVVAPEDSYPATVLLCAHLLFNHHLDLASALLLVGSHRPAIWSDLDRLWSFDWSSLIAD